MVVAVHHVLPSHQLGFCQYRFSADHHGDLQRIRCRMATVTKPSLESCLSLGGAPPLRSCPSLRLRWWWFVCSYFNVFVCGGYLCCAFCVVASCCAVLCRRRCLFVSEVKFLDLLKHELPRKHLPMMFSLSNNGGDRRRSGTVVVFTMKPPTCDWGRWLHDSFSTL